MHDPRRGRGLIEIQSLYSLNLNGNKLGVTEQFTPKLGTMGRFIGFFAGSHLPKIKTLMLLILENVENCNKIQSKPQ